MGPQYVAAGWSPLPLPPKEKNPPPTGFTGVSGAYVDLAQVKKWCRERARYKTGNTSFLAGNVALRLPKTVLGVDVDVYSGKAGATTLARAEVEWGTLPPTWVSTSRTDGISGIRLFRIPEGLAWPGELPFGKGVELLRWDHRFAIVFPSIHPEGATYAWYLQDADSGELVASPDDFPAPGDLAQLPDAWVEGLTGGAKWNERAADEEMGDDAARAWLASCLGASGNPCAAFTRSLPKLAVGIHKAGDDGGAHDTVRDAVWGVIRDGAVGHKGVAKALATLKKAFLQNVKGRRDSERIATGEWARIVIRGIQKISLEFPAPEQEDPCTALGDGSVIDLEDLAGSARLCEPSERGNSQRLVMVMNNRARYIAATKTWMIWRGDRWSPDEDGKVDRWSWDAIDRIEKEIAYLEADADEDVLKAYRAHAKSSKKFTAFKAMQGLATGRKGITVPPATFDADPALINCPNGTLELKPDGLVFRPTHAREDYLTLSTGVEYEEGATHELWDGYLKRFLPDEEVRDWLQRLVGYSLFGDNAEQLLVVCQGVTSTGKTTLSEALQQVLGGYGGPLEASILRGNADDRARPDILKALPRRLVIAEELSEFQYLHVDQVKRITGAGSLSARHMRSDKFVERRPAFTPWIMTNETPTIEGGDAALKNRVLVVPFDVAMPRTRAAGQVRTRILKEAGSAVLAWATAGWDKYTAGSDLREIPAGALAANLKFHEEMSEFHSFLAERCDVGSDYHESRTDLYDAYLSWCSEHQIKERDQLTLTKFGKRLAGMGYGVDKRTVDGSQVRRRIGLRLVANEKIVGGR